MGILLDLGCGPYKAEGHVGIDSRPLPIVDIVHDIETFPYPFDDGACDGIRAHHILEHIRPQKTVEVFNELWRIMVMGGDLDISVPYAGSNNFWQDPTHCNGFIELTFWYFDPTIQNCNLYTIYSPKPWQIVAGPIKQANSNLDVTLRKIGDIR